MLAAPTAAALPHRPTRQRQLKALIFSMLTLACLCFSPGSAQAATYVVWTCYGGQWWSSATTTTSSQANSYKKLFEQYGYKTQITNGARPTGSCAAPAKKCLYYAEIWYNGRYYYMGGYTTPEAARTAGQAYQRSVRGAYYTGYKTECK